MDGELFYMLNESLLDDVEVDEVEDDDDTSSTKIKIAVQFSCVLAKSIVKKTLLSTLGSILQNIKKSSRVRDYYFNFDDSVDFLNFKIDIEVTFDNASGEFNDMFCYIIAWLYSYIDRCSMTNIRFVVQEDDLFFKIEISNKKTNRIICLYEILDFYKKVLGTNDISDFVHKLIKFDVLNPIDDNKTRFCIWFHDNEELVVFDRKGNKIGRFVINMANVIDKDWYFNEYGLMLIYDNKGKMNYMKLDGTLLLEEYADSCGLFSEGLCTVKKNGLWNYVDINGNIINDEKWYESCRKFINGFAIVKSKEKQADIYTYGIIRPDGSFVLNDCWRYIENIKSNNNYWCVRRKDKKENVLNNSGNFISNEWFDDVEDFNGDYILVNNNLKYNYLKLDGNLLFKKWYQGIVKNDMHDGCVCAVQEDDVWGFVDMSTEEYVNDLRFGSCIRAYKESGALLTGDEQLFIVTKQYQANSLTAPITVYNYVNTEGELISKNEWFSEVRALGNYRLMCKKIDSNDLYKIIDYSGNVIRDYEKIYKYDVLNDGKYIEITIIDNSYNFCKFCDIDGNDLFKGELFSNEKIGYAGCGIFVYEEKGGKSYMLTETGNKIMYDDKRKINGIEIIDPDGYVIVEDSYLRYNMFDKNGERLFKDWTFDRITNYSPGILKIGQNVFVDYGGKLLSCL